MFQHEYNCGSEEKKRSLKAMAWRRHSNNEKILQYQQQIGAELGDLWVCSEEHSLFKTHPCAGHSLGIHRKHQTVHVTTPLMEEEKANIDFILENLTGKRNMEIKLSFGCLTKVLFVFHSLGLRISLFQLGELFQISAAKLINVFINVSGVLPTKSLHLRPHYPAAGKLKFSSLSSSL